MILLNKRKLKFLRGISHNSTKLNLRKVNQSETVHRRKALGQLERIFKQDYEEEEGAEEEEERAEISRK